MNMLRGLILICTLIAALMSATAQEAAKIQYHVGEAPRAFKPKVTRNWRGAKTERLVTTLWYPVDPGLAEQPHDIGAPGHPVFRGHPVAWGAPLSSAAVKYPLILLSHGTGGSANDLDWLASTLAANGYIVAGVNHPGNNALEPLTREGFMLWWERATDVSEVLDAVLSDPVFGARIDRGRIGAGGFSLGGYTVLELAGARTNLEAFRSFCRSSVADAICHPAEMSRVAADTGRPVPAAMSLETQASIAKAGASYRDKRIKAVFAIAPALGEAFDSTSFVDVEIPVSLAAGTADVTAPPDTNIHRIARLLRAPNVAMVQGASHNTFLDNCVPQVVDQLATVCTDDPGVDRDAIHEQTAHRILDFFDQALR
jgi:predicted dienelactone hydrolase